MRRISLVAAVAVVVASVVPGVAQAAPATLTWGACPADVTAPGLECSTLDVPLDYRKPDGHPDPGRDLAAEEHEPGARGAGSC